MDKQKQVFVNHNKEILLRQLVTYGDLQDLKTELLEQIKSLLNTKQNSFGKKWLKSYEVEALLGISANTLMSWRNNGLLPFTALGGVFYYDPEDIEKVMQKHKSETGKNGKKRFR